MPIVVDIKESTTSNSDGAFAINNDEMMMNNEDFIAHSIFTNSSISNFHP